MIVQVREWILYINSMMCVSLCHAEERRQKRSDSCGVIYRDTRSPLTFPVRHSILPRRRRRRRRSARGPESVCSNDERGERQRCCFFSESLPRQYPRYWAPPLCLSTGRRQKVRERERGSERKREITFCLFNRKAMKEGRGD